MDIRCRKTKCLYNDHFICRADKIDISKSCECNKYTPTNKTPPDTSKKMLERTPIYKNYRECKCIDICCHANCLFCNKTKCEANGITINTIKEKPFCMTFLANK